MFFFEFVPMFFGIWSVSVESKTDLEILEEYRLDPQTLEKLKMKLGYFLPKFNQIDFSIEI